MEVPNVIACPMKSLLAYLFLLASPIAVACECVPRAMPAQSWEECQDRLSAASEVYISATLEVDGEQWPLRLFKNKVGTVACVDSMSFCRPLSVIGRPVPPVGALFDMATSRAEAADGPPYTGDDWRAHPELGFKAPARIEIESENPRKAATLHVGAVLLLR